MYELWESAKGSMPVYTKALIQSLSEVMVQLNLDTEIGQEPIRSKFDRVLSFFTSETRKVEIGSIVAATYEPIIQNEWKLVRQFGLIFDWLATHVLGNAFILEEIKPLVPLLIKCLDQVSENSIYVFVEEFINSLFEKFGGKKTKDFIENSLINSSWLYSIFF